MKKNELNFKVLTGTMSRCQQLINALLDKCFFEAKDIRVDNKVIFCDGGNLTCSFQVEAIEDRKYLPEMTFREALELIWKVEPEQQDGGFVEFKVDEGGFFYPPLDGSDLMGMHWQSSWDIAEATEGEYTFAGWKWAIEDNSTLYTGLLYGFDEKEQLISLAGEWVKPAQPTHVRFWRRKI